MRVLVDARLIIEAVLERKNNFSENTAEFYEILCENKQEVQGYISSIGIEKIHSYLKQKKIVNEIIQDTGITVCEIGKNEIQEIRRTLNHIIDIDSAVDLFCAKTNELEAIVTLNPKNYFPSNTQNDSSFNVPIYEVNYFCLEALQKDQSNHKYLIEDSQTKAFELPIQLSEWRQNQSCNILQENWDTIENILGRRTNYRYHPQNPQNSGRIGRAKKIEISKGHQIALVIYVTPESTNELDILVQLYALSLQYLSKHTKLIIYNDSGNKFQEAQPQIGDIGIQINFTAEIGDKFYIEIKNENYSFFESFIV
jgi:hypothetical protein